MAKELLTNPTVVNFRYGTVGREHLNDLYLVNDGNEDLVVSGLGFGTVKYASVTPVPFTIPAVSNYQVKIKFLPVTGDEDDLLSDTLTITHDGDNGPTTEVVVSGTGKASLAPQLGFAPSSWSFDWLDGRNFLDGILVGEISNLTNILLTNYGDLPVVIIGLFPIASGVKILSAPSLPYALSPGSSTLVSFTIESQVTGLQTVDLFGVITNAQIPFIGTFIFAHEFSGSYTGIVVTSAHTLTGATRRTLAAFGDTIRQIDDSDLEVEQTARLVKTFDFGFPYQEKFVSRLRVRYEDLGEAVIQVQLVTLDGTTTISPNPAIGTVTADGKTRELLVDFTLTERVVELRITHVSGPVSIIDFGLEYEPQGVAITTE